MLTLSNIRNVINYDSHSAPQNDSLLYRSHSLNHLMVDGHLDMKLKGQVVISVEGLIVFSLPFCYLNTTATYSMTADMVRIILSFYSKEKFCHTDGLTCWKGLAGTKH